MRNPGCEDCAYKTTHSYGIVVEDMRCIFHGFWLVDKSSRKRLPGYCWAMNSHKHCPGYISLLNWGSQPLPKGTIHKSWWLRLRCALFCG